MFIICIGCNYSKPDSSQTIRKLNKGHLPGDSMASYLSTFQPFDSSQLELTMDSYWQNHLSGHLYGFREPILYNDSSDSEIFRFLWLRSFHKPMVFVIKRDGGAIAITTKKLDRRIFTEDYRYVSPPREDSLFSSMGYHVQKETDTVAGKVEVVSVIKAHRTAPIIYDSTIPISKAEWEHLSFLLKESNFWSLPAFEWGSYADGAMWLFEVRDKARYKWFVRQSPEGKLLEVGSYIIKLSGLKEEIY